MSGNKAAEMIRLGNLYSDLADAINGPIRASSLGEEDAAHDCPQCGIVMKPIQLFPQTELFPARQMFCCVDCGETLTCRRS